MKTLQQELDELRAIRDIKNGKLFKEFLVNPIYAEIGKLGKAYDCENIEELATLKGKYEAHTFFIGLLKKIDEDIEIKESQLKSDEE